MPKLKYKLVERRTFSNMKCFGKGVTLPKDGDWVLDCSEKEAKELLKLKRGGVNVFEKVGGGRRRKSENEVVEHAEEKVFE